jgi:hypothetical protein
MFADPGPDIRPCKAFTEIAESIGLRQESDAAAMGHPSAVESRSRSGTGIRKGESVKAKELGLKFWAAVALSAVGMGVVIAFLAGFFLGQYT